MSRAELSETVRIRPSRRATLACIRTKPYQRRSATRLRQVGAAARSTLRSKVIGWWIVVTSGRPAALDVQHPVAERLVVVDDVEVVEPLAQQPGGAQAEGAWLGEARGPHRGDLEKVDPVTDLAGPGSAERVRLAVQVQAGDLGEPHARVEHRVGLPREHLDVVPEGDELAAQVPDVDALTTTVRLAAVGQQGYPHVDLRFVRHSPLGLKRVPMIALRLLAYGRTRAWKEPSREHPHDHGRLAVP